jgi:hypothetical protein
MGSIISFAEQQQDEGSDMIWSWHFRHVIFSNKSSECGVETLTSNRHSDWDSFAENTPTIEWL